MISYFISYFLLSKFLCFQFYPSGQFYVFVFSIIKKKFNLVLLLLISWFFFLDSFVKVFMVFNFIFQIKFMAFVFSTTTTTIIIIMVMIMMIVYYDCNGVNDSNDCDDNINNCDHN